MFKEAENMFNNLGQSRSLSYFKIDVYKILKETPGLKQST